MCSFSYYLCSFFNLDTFIGTVTIYAYIQLSIIGFKLERCIIYVDYIGWLIIVSFITIKVLKHNLTAIFIPYINLCPYTLLNCNLLSYIHFYAALTECYVIRSLTAHAKIVYIKSCVVLKCIWITPVGCIYNTIITFYKCILLSAKSIGYGVSPTGYLFTSRNIIKCNYTIT